MWAGAEQSIDLTNHLWGKRLCGKTGFFLKDCLEIADQLENVEVTLVTTSVRPWRLS